MKKKQRVKSVQDPICGSMVDPKETKVRSRYEGSTYFFCGQECKNEFDQNPKVHTERKVA